MFPGRVLALRACGRGWLWRSLSIQLRIFAPVLILIVSHLSHPGPALAEKNGFDAEEVTLRHRIAPYALQPKNVFARVRPEVEQVDLPIPDLGGIKIDYSPSLTPGRSSDPRGIRYA